MTFVKLEQLLPKSVKKADITNQLDSAKILVEFNEVAKKVFGESIMKKIKPLYLKNGTLSVACLSSVLGERLKNQERKVLAELNRPYREKVVERLRFLV